MRFSANVSTARHASTSRRGTAFLLVLAVLVMGFGMISAVQHALTRRTMGLRMERAEAHLRGALLTSLRLGVERLAEEEGGGPDHPGDEWAQLVEFETEEGVWVRFRLRDAQDRFNLNWLTRPEALPAARGADEVFAALLRPYELRPDPQAMGELGEAGKPLYGAGDWVARDPRAAEWLRATEEGDPSELWVSLPLPATGVTRLNLNSVDERVLRALVGEALGAWVDMVLRMRAEEPIRSMGSVLEGLPPPLRSALGQVVDVRSDYVELIAVAETDHTVKSLRALLRRGEEGEVEVVRCQW